MPILKLFKEFGSNIYSKVTSLAASGNSIIAAGSTEEFSNGLVNPAINKKRFINKFDTNGVQIWEKIGETGSFVNGEGGIAETSPSVASDSNGNLYIAGRIIAKGLPTDDFAIPDKNKSSSPEGYVTKLNQNGAIIWSRLVEPINGGRFGATITDFKTDANNNAWVFGFCTAHYTTKMAH